MSVRTVLPDHAADLAVVADSPRELEDLVREHMALVGHLVRELMSRLPGHVYPDDLCSAGFAALLAAARSYEPDRGIPFHRYAAVRIRGALLDELRGQDWASRSVRSRARRTEAARQELTAVLGRMPTDAEVAELLGVRVSEVAAIEEEVHKAAVLSLQGFSSGSADDLVTERAAGPEDLLLHRERVGYLHQAIQALPDRLRLVVTASFLQERPIAEVAAELGVTESRVSQLRTEALRLLREGLRSSLDAEQRHADTVGGGGPAARRHADYLTRVAQEGSLHTRLALTDHHGVPIAVAA